MFLSNLSIKKPYFAFMINMVILLFGVLAFQKLPVSNSPNVDIPYVWVSVDYPGASPSTVEDLILKPIEDNLKSISGVKNMHGTARTGNASLFLEFNLEVSADKALEDVRNEISTIKFPENMERPQVGKEQYNSESILTIAIAAPGMSIQELSYLVKNNIQPQIQRINGVSQLYVAGDRTREIHIELKQEMLKAMNLSPLFIQQSINNQIINSPVGQLKQLNDISNIITYKIPSTLDEVAKMPLRLEKNNQVIRLEDIADIRDSMSDATSYVEFNNTPFLSLNIYKEPQGNLVKIAEEVKQKINKLNAEYKGKLQFNIVRDHSTFIKESVKGVEVDLVLGTIFAVLAVFVFLHEWKNTLICGFAIPTSLVGTLAVIHYLQFSLNFMTLFALTLCIGIVIDDAIVVVENIHRHKVLGKNSLQAAIEGTQEIGFAAIAVTLSIVSVFIPVAFMQGEIGRFFYEFGMTVAIAVAISLFVAFTAVPMFSSKINTITDKKSHLFILFDVWFEKFQTAYANLIKKVLHFKKTTILMAVAMFIVSILLLKFVPVMFDIDSDEGTAHISFFLAQNTPLEVTKRRGQQIEHYIEKLPGVKNIWLEIGGGANGAANKIDLFVYLVDKTKRNFTDKQFQSFLADGLKQFIQNPNEHVGFFEGDYPLQISLMSSKSELLKSYGETLAKYMNTLPRVQGATTSSQELTYEFKIIPRETQSALVSVNSQNITNTLQLLFDGIKVGKYNDNGQYLDIKMSLPRNDYHSLSDLSSILIPNQSGGLVLLSSIAKIEKQPIDSIIEHLNGDRVLTVKANYSGNDLAGVTKEIQKYMDKTMPLDVTNKFAGQSGEVQEMLSTVGFSLILAIIFVFMVLCVQFENIIAPLTILMSIPFAFSGAFVALLATKNPLSIYSMIGIIMLMGLVTKNAILLIEFAQTRVKQNISVEQALIEAAKMRLRPILMTTITMIVGMLPMALSRGEGSEIRANIAVTVIGGLMSSTFLTLLIIPCVYLIFIKIALSIKRKQNFT